MWCANCQSDVAAEASSDNRSIRCANCSQSLDLPRTSPHISKTQEARQLLERWANERIVDPYGPLRKKVQPAAESAPKTVTSKNSVSEKQSPETAVPEKQTAETETSTSQAQPAKRKKLIRIDAGHAGPRPHTLPKPKPETQQEKDQPETVAIPAASSSPKAAQPAQRTPLIDAAHTLSGPHFSVAAKQDSASSRKLNWMAVAGQWLSYLGILGLMSGTGLVILGYFRGPGTYVPTGWLITMAGQMLLFLGVVTMVSSGMEQNTETVEKKLDHLNDRILRFEQATLELRGPHNPNEKATGKNDEQPPESQQPMSA